MKRFIAAIILVFVLQPCLVRAQDTDGDGYEDAVELSKGWSPYNPEPIKIEKSDADGDGLNDKLELAFRCDPLTTDSDGDGYDDGLEVDKLYDPAASGTKRLPARLEVDTKKQALTLFIGGQPWKTYKVSTGKPSMPTPKGTFKVVNKIDKAWSKPYKLWMPYWMGLGSGAFGIHELPLWPDGYREGADHLGKAVSHGCIRLGIGPAQYLYERISTGTEVRIR